MKTVVLLLTRLKGQFEVALGTNSAQPVASSLNTPSVVSDK